jgi:rubrerythrin
VSVEFIASDSLPYVGSVYVCPVCGHKVTQYAGHSGEQPTGWIAVQAGQPDWECPHCAEQSAKAAQSR